MCARLPRARRCYEVLKTLVWTAQVRVVAGGRTGFVLVKLLRLFNPAGFGASLAP